jgi:hypothetical protein
LTVKFCCFYFYRSVIRNSYYFSLPTFPLYLSTVPASGLQRMYKPRVRRPVKLKRLGAAAGTKAGCGPSIREERGNDDFPFPLSKRPVRTFAINNSSHREERGNDDFPFPLSRKSRQDFLRPCQVDGFSTKTSTRPLGRPNQRLAHLARVPGSMDNDHLIDP